MLEGWDFKVKDKTNIYEDNTISDKKRVSADFQE